MIITLRNIISLLLGLLILSLVAVIALAYSRNLASIKIPSELNKAQKFLVNSERKIFIGLEIALVITILSIILTWGLTGSVVVYDAKYRKILREYIHEATRRLETAIPFEKAVLFIESAYFFQIDDNPKEPLFGIDRKEKDLLDYKFDGLPLRRYRAEYTESDFMDALQGPQGSRFLRIKVIRHHKDCAGCLWIRKVFVELPNEGNLVFTQNEGVESVAQAGVSNYAEITMFLRTEDGIERCGMVRLHTKHGFDITNNGELVSSLSTKTDAEITFERQTKGMAEAIERNDNLVRRHSRGTPGQFIEVGDVGGRFESISEVTSWGI